MAGVMEAIVGPWGKVFISVGLLISVLGNYLSWSLLAAEVLYSAAGKMAPCRPSSRVRTRTRCRSARCG